jgi:hypothetical protein
MGTGGVVVPAEGVDDVPSDDVHAAARRVMATSRRRDDFTGEPAT